MTSADSPLHLNVNAVHFSKKKYVLRSFFLSFKKKYQELENSLCIWQISKLLCVTNLICDQKVTSRSNDHDNRIGVRSDTFIDLQIAERIRRYATNCKLGN